MKRILFAFLFCVGSFSSLLQAQSQPLRHYSVQDGLPSSAVYHAIQDQHGYMWFATTEGVAKFDGYQFRIFNTQHGLPYNDVFGIQEDDQGRIWVFSFASDLYFIQNDSVHRIELPGSYGGPHSLRSIAKDGQGRYWLRSDAGGLIWEGDTITPFIESEENLCDHFLFQDDHHTEWYLNKNAIACFDRGQFHKVFMLDTIHDWVVVTPQKECVIKDKSGELTRFWPDKGILCSMGKDELFKDSHLAQMGWGRGVAEMSSYVFYTEEGVVLLDEILNPVELEGQLADQGIKAFIRDRNGNRWYSSITHGVWFFPKRAEWVVNRSVQDGFGQANITALESLPGGDLLLGTENGVFMLFREGKEISRLRVPWQRSVRKIGVVEGGKIVVLGDAGLGSARIDSSGIRPRLIWTNSHRYLLGIIDYVVESKNGNEYVATAAKSFLETPDSGIIYTTSGGFWKEKQLTESSAHFTQIRYERTYGLALGKEGLMYSGHPNGLSVFRMAEPEKMYRFPEMKGKFINELAVTPDSVLWVGTTGNGAFIYFEGQFVEIPELQNRSINQINVDRSRNEVWMATDRGAWCIEVESYVPFEYQINTISKRDGILSESINSIAVHDSMIYLGTNLGLSTVRRSLLLQPAPSFPIHISGARIEGKEVPLAEHYDLRYDENDIVINFVGLSYAEKGTQGYAYRMQGVDQDWRKTHELQANYPQLMPGDYRFEVKILLDGDIAASDTIGIDFHIATHWAETWWFRISAFFAIILLVVIGVRWRFLALQKRERLAHQTERKLSDLEGRALQAQMNPHFIFNSLNAIQYLMNSGQRDKANIYLASFGKLIRMNLETAEESSYSLAEELRRLEYYLSLEKLRLNEGISYQIELESGLNADEVQIPCMILQPFVENAIWHGILPTERSGKVEVYVKKSSAGGHLVEIQDNGIGIDQSRKTKPNGHTSKGINLVRRRLELLHPNRKDYNPVHIRELKDVEGQTTGTQVEIHF